MLNNATVRYVRKIELTPKSLPTRSTISSASSSFLVNLGELNGI